MFFFSPLPLALFSSLCSRASFGRASLHPSSFPHATRVGFCPKAIYFSSHCAKECKAGRKRAKQWFPRQRGLKQPTPLTPLLRSRLKPIACRRSLGVCLSGARRGEGAWIGPVLLTFCRRLAPYASPVSQSQGLFSFISELWWKTISLRAAAVSVIRSRSPEGSDGVKEGLTEEMKERNESELLLFRSPRSFCPPK